MSKKTRVRINPVALFGLGLGTFLTVSGTIYYSNTDVKDHEIKEAPNESIASSVDAYLSSNPVLPYLEGNATLKFDNFYKDGEYISLNSIYNWCNERGYITKEELIEQLKHFAHIKDDHVMPFAETAQLSLKDKKEDIKVEIEIYEKYLDFLLTRGIAAIDNSKYYNSNYTMALLGKKTKNDPDINPDNLNSAMARLESTKNTLTDEDYLNKLNEIAHRYSGELKGLLGVTIDVWEKQVDEKLNESPKENNNFSSDNLIDVNSEEALNIIKDIIKKSDCALCGKEDITYTIPASDWTVELISQHLADKGLYITAENIISQTRARYENPTHYLGDYLNIPQYGAELALTINKALPLDVQLNNIRNAFVNYLTKIKLPEEDAWLQDLANQWCQGNLSDEQKDAIWLTLMDNFQKVMPGFTAIVIEATQEQLELPEGTLSSLQEAIGFPDTQHLPGGPSF